MLLFLSVTKSILLGLPGFHFHIFNSESLQDFFRFCFLVLCSGNSLKTMHLDNFRALSFIFHISGKTFLCFLIYLVMKIVVSYHSPPPILSLLHKESFSYIILARSFPYVLQVDIISTIPSRIEYCL